MEGRVPPRPRAETSAPTRLQHPIPKGEIGPGRPKGTGAVDAHKPVKHQKKANARGAKVVFEDEVCFQQEGTTRRSWARRGIGFTVYHQPCKRSAKYFGAISMDPRPRLVYRSANTFNSRTFETFLNQLVDRFGMVCLILDNVAYHKARRIRRVLRRLHGRLWLYSLPKYSPELNAQEMVWRETRKDATHNRFFGTMKGLRRAVQSQFRAYQAQPQLLVGCVAQFLRVSYPAGGPGPGKSF